MIPALFTNASIWPNSAERRLDRLVDCGLVGDIANEEPRRVGPGPGLRPRRLLRRQVAIDDSHVGPVASQTQSDGAAQPDAAAPVTRAVRPERSKRSRDHD